MSSFTANFQGLELHSSRLRKVNVIPYAQTKAKRFQDFVQMYFVRIEWQNSKSKATVLSKGPIVYYVPRGGGGFGGGGYNFKTSPFLGGKFFSGKKHEGGQIL